MSNDCCRLHVAAAHVILHTTLFRVYFIIITTMGSARRSPANRSTQVNVNTRMKTPKYESRGCERKLLIAFRISREPKERLIKGKERA